MENTESAAATPGMPSGAPAPPPGSLAKVGTGETSARVGKEAEFSFAAVSHLTRALKRGDEAAYSWLHSQWSPRLNRYCFAVAGGDEAFASEIVQAMWLRAVRHIRVLQDEAALWNWMACAARHAAIDHHRKAGRYRRVLGRFSERWRGLAANPISSDGAEIALLEALDTALGKLDEEESSLIADRYFNSASLDIIATCRGLTVRAVEGRLARLRVRLRKLIAHELKSSQP